LNDNTLETKGIAPVRAASVEEWNRKGTVSIQTSFETVVSGRQRQGTKADLVRLLRVLAAAAVLTALLVSFNPFPTNIAKGDGVILNRVGYSLLAAFVLGTHVVVTDPRILKHLLNPWWLLLLLPLPLSLWGAGWPPTGVRAMLFTFSTMLAATGVLTLPPDARGFRTALILACGAVLALSYAGIIMLPDRAIHTAAEVEAEHAGLWRGIYAHKNITGPVMAVIVFAGIYVVRSGRPLVGVALTVLGLIFLFKTGSKTSLALVPLIAAMALLGPVLLGRGRTALALFLAVAGILALTLGAVIVPFFGDILHSLIPGTTFTGRTDLWQFALDLAAPLPWTGHGYENFWTTPYVEFAEKPFELDWDMRGAANAHNSYLDVVLQLGWPAVAIVLLVILVFPLVDYARCRPDIENRRLADFFVMVLGFMLLNAALESFFFDREKQAWLLAWIAVVGLRFTSRMTAEP